MNIALPAIVIILGLLPGIVFFGSYYSGRFIRQISGISGTSEVAQYVIFAVPIDAAALWLTNKLGVFLDFELAARTLTGGDPLGTAKLIAENFRLHWPLTTITYSGLLFGSLVLGNIARRIVWTFRLDMRVPFLRMKHEWYYVLQGRLASLPRESLPYADLLVSHPAGTQLYQGLVSSFEVTESGAIRELILHNARRGKGRGDDFQWREIPSDRFVVMGPSILSINMRYVAIEFTDQSRRERLARWWRRTWRALVLQEP